MTQSRKIKWGILGTHWISGVMAKAIQESTSSKLIAIGSRDITKAILFSKEYNVPTYYTNYQELLSDPDIDAVYIGLPNHLHKEWIIRCAKAGKNILCEKSFVLNMHEMEIALNTVKENKVFCMEALMYLCHPFIQSLQNIIDSKIIGDIKNISAVYTVNIAAQENKTAGGAIRNLGCYPLSLITLLVKAELAYIIGSGQLDESGRNDNVSIGILHFKNGVTASITTANTHEWWWQFTIFGTKGIINIKTNPWFPSNHNQLIVKTHEKEEILDFYADKSLYTYQIDCVADHIKKGVLSPSTLGVTWDHSCRNISILDEWLTQVKANKHGILGHESKQFIKHHI